jgi:hypothetical protein
MLFRVRRVCCRRCCCQRRGCVRDATAGSGPIGLPPRLRPSVSRPGPCRFPYRRCSGQKKPSVCAPLVNFSLSLRVPGSFALPVAHHPLQKVGCCSLAPLLRFAPLQRSKYKASTQRGVACRFVPTSPFLTTSSVCSAIYRPAISAGGTPGVCFAFRVTPVPPSSCCVSAVPVPSWPSQGGARLSRGLCRSEELRRHTSLPCLQGFTRWVDRCRSRSGFPFARTRPPHGVSLCGTSCAASELASASLPSKLRCDLFA